MTTGPQEQIDPIPIRSEPPDWMGRLVRTVQETEPGYFAKHAPGPRRRGRAAAVLMLYGPSPSGGEDVVLTQRTAHLRSHPGQVSFPGGRLDPDDAGPSAAALREAHEEIGLDISGVQLLGELPQLYLSASGSVVTPVLAWWREPSPISAHSEEEVARVARVRIADLLDPANRFIAVHPSGYRAPAFEVDELFIWGFTAALLSATFDLAGLDPGTWNRQQERDVPLQGFRAQDGRQGTGGPQR